jgi:hypothetical protein
MASQNRDTLKSFFRKGSLPTEGHFADLIDSSLNKVEDGISKTPEDGLRLLPFGTSSRLTSFYKSIEDKNPTWSMDIESGTANLNFNSPQAGTVLSLNGEGRVGILNPNPEHTLDVNGFVGMHGRLGTLKVGRVPGDGQWHPAIGGLTGCHLFEVVAGIGKKKTGKYCLIHAIAGSTFGKSKSDISMLRAYYGVRCNQIQLRWTGTTYDYTLEIRTRCDYGGNYFIQYYISELWPDPEMDGSAGE